VTLCGARGYLSAARWMIALPRGSVTDALSIPDG
jgi:hypothetical protein